MLSKALFLQFLKTCDCVAMLKKKTYSLKKKKKKKFTFILQKYNSQNIIHFLHSLSENTSTLLSHYQTTKF